MKTVRSEAIKEFEQDLAYCELHIDVLTKLMTRKRFKIIHDNFDTLSFALDALIQKRRNYRHILEVLDDAV